MIKLQLKLWQPVTERLPMASDVQTHEYPIVKQVDNKAHIKLIASQQISSSNVT